MPLLRRAFNQHGAGSWAIARCACCCGPRTCASCCCWTGSTSSARGASRPGATPARLLDNFPGAAVHLTCRTADFDAAARPIRKSRCCRRAVWTVQELADAIRYWDDDEGESDVRAYFRRHLGERAAGGCMSICTRRTARALARLPLFLWMFKEAAGDAASCRPTGASCCAASCARRACWGVSRPELRSRPSAAWSAWAGACRGRRAGDGRRRLYATCRRCAGRASTRWTRCAASEQSGLLMDLGEERYKLLHQLIQEYAAAAHLLGWTTAAAGCPCWRSTNGGARPASWRCGSRRNCRRRSTCLG